MLLAGSHTIVDVRGGQELRLFGDVGFGCEAQNIVCISGSLIYLNPGSSTGAKKNPVS